MDKVVVRTLKEEIDHAKSMAGLYMRYAKLPRMKELKYRNYILADKWMVRILKLEERLAVEQARKD